MQPSAITLVSSYRSSNQSSSSTNNSLTTSPLTNKRENGRTLFYRPRGAPIDLVCGAQTLCFRVPALAATRGGGETAILGFRRRYGVNLHVGGCAWLMLDSEGEEVHRRPRVD